MKVGTAKRVAGECQQGYIKTAELVGGAEVRVPVFVVGGKEEGPVLWINAGVHGEEVSGIFAIHNVIRSINPAELKGTIIATPACNPLAIKGCNKFTPEDQLDMDQQFPGRPKGWLSEQMAYHFFNEVKEHADYMLDLHALGGVDAVPYTVFKSVGDVPEEINAKTRDLALLIGFQDNCFVDLSTAKGELPGPLLGALDIQCVLHGIPAVMVELGAGNRIIWENVALAEKGIYNVLKYLGMIEGEIEKTSGQRIIAKRDFFCNQRAGLAVAEAKPGQTVKAGECIARVIDFHGNELERMTASQDVYLLGVIENPVVNSGKVVAAVGLEWEEVN